MRLGRRILVITRRAHSWDEMDMWDDLETTAWGHGVRGVFLSVGSSRDLAAGRWVF